MKVYKASESDLSNIGHQAISKPVEELEKMAGGVGNGEQVLGGELEGKLNVVGEDDAVTAVGGQVESIEVSGAVVGGEIVGALAGLTILKTGATQTGEGDEAGAGAGAGAVINLDQVPKVLQVGPTKGGEGGDLDASIASPQVECPPVLASDLKGAGEGGEAGGGVVMPTSNAEFVAAMQLNLAPGAVLAVCSKPGDPEQGPWLAQAAGDLDVQCPAGQNNYVNTSALWPQADGSVKAQLNSFAGLWAIVLDDVDTKVPRERLAGIEPTWEVETSPGNSQMGFVLDPPITDSNAAKRFQAKFADGGLSDPGTKGVMRWVRLPWAINGKPKHQDASGKPFQSALKQFNPKNRFTPTQLVQLLGVTLGKEATAGKPKNAETSKAAKTGSAVYTPKAAENPVMAALKEKELYKRPLGSVKHEVTCPWLGEHTDALDTGAAYFEPTDQFPIGGFRCQHSHGENYHIADLLGDLGVDGTDARHRAQIRLIPGEINRILEAAELELILRGNCYQAGSLIVSIGSDPKTGDPFILPTNEQALTQALAACADWYKFDGRSSGWVRTDPPTRHVSMLYKSRIYTHLPRLAGVTRQPYFRETDGQLVTLPGHDPVSQMFGVFDPEQYVLPEPTKEAAQAALKKLRQVLREFHFAHDHDESAAVAALFTAALRAAIELAPAFHVNAHASGSGKSLLCEVIGAMAGPGGNRKLSYPKNSEEATKVILSLLLGNPAVVEFDDMDTDWLPHGVINRMLTSTHITDRILGSSKVATVSTRTLFLGSGNNVGPVRDLVRRVITITLDTKSESPATLKYEGDPLKSVRENRAELVSAVITIVRAWQLAGSPKSDVPNIASYGGAWSDYCRHPLIWLGLPDPVTALFTQLQSDPDLEIWRNLATVWMRVFGSNPTTVRKVIKEAYERAQNDSPSGRRMQPDHDLLDAICEFPVVERGSINASKLGWLLKRNANRVVGGMRIEPDHADGRRAWRVVAVDTPPPSPALPVSDHPDLEIVTANIDATDDTSNLDDQSY